MGIKKEIKGVWNEAAYSFNLMGENKLVVLQNVIFDVLTLFFIGYVSAMFSKKALEYMYSIGALLTKASGSTMFVTQSFFDFAKQAGITPILFNLVLVLLVWILFSYFVYCFFQSLCWKNARSLIGEKHVLNKFSLRFFKLNIFWAIVYVIFNLIVYMSLFMSSVGSTSEVEIGSLPGIIMLIIGYFAFISYSVFGKDSIIKTLKLTFVSGVKCIHCMLMRLLLIGVVFFGIDILLKTFSKIHPFVMVLAGIILFVPAVTWSRIYFIYSIKQLKK